MGKLTNAKHRIQHFAYDTLKLKEVTEREERDTLTKAMGFAGQWDEHRRFQFEFLKQNGVTPATHFLEVGCGPLTLGVPLIDYLDKLHYTGVDVRPSVAAIAYQQIAKHGLAGKNPRIIVSDNFAAEELGGAIFDTAWSFSVLYHLTDELVEKLFATIAARLGPSGRYWANINAEVEESTWLEFPFMRRQPGFYENVAHKSGLSMRTRGPLKDLGFRLPSLEKNNILLEFTPT